MSINRSEEKSILIKPPSSNKALQEPLLINSKTSDDESEDLLSGGNLQTYNTDNGTFNNPGKVEKHDLKSTTRVIRVNDHVANQPFKFPKNDIKTTKYTYLNFIFKNLWEQFHRFANCYFLVIAILQLIPTLSPTGQFTTFIPLGMVLIFTMMKDAYEDIRRRYSDNITNKRTAHVLRDGVFVDVFWKDVQTGDIVRVCNREPFPCDLILLSSSEHQGICYIETSSLDGETNLKIRRARHETMDMISPNVLENTRMTLECEKPNNRLYKFEGTLIMSNGKKLSLDPEQVCLRGSSLRNTDFIIGIAVFTGHDTKLMMNTKETPHKTSRIERMTNKLVLLVLALEITLIVICDICLMIWTANNGKMWYLFKNFNVNAGEVAWIGFKGFWTFLILLNNLIPISLYVSIEAAKLVQGIIISKDLQMYHEDTDTPANVRSSALNEELGQVNFIFSDKTGTLTENKMDFMKCSVAGELYGTGVTEIALAAAKREGKVIADNRPPHVKNNPNFQFYDERLMNGVWQKGSNRAVIEDFLRLLAVCHTVIPERGKGQEIIYQASSPDEAALVKAAKYLGVEFIARTPNEVTIRLNGVDETYQVLDIIEFSSDRKRQSVIVRDPQGKLILLCKGADSVIYPLLKQPQPYGDITLKHLEIMGTEGLRTLLCAKAYLDEAEYEQWHKQYEEAKTSLEDRTAKVETTAAKIEKNMELVGATGIEDKLQTGVADTIYELGNAGIKIWVLTGDKLETAINIGFACDLLNSAMSILVVEGHTYSDIKEFLETSLNAANNAKESEDVLGLVVDGERLHSILEDHTLREVFLQLAIKCKSVVCCRVSPKQKADVVLLVKQNVDSITLAIGDGANDVSMIQSAHVGIGISGVEGLQAANSSDYSIGQFRFLKRLLLVHGRWSYRRVSKLVLYCFYKNSILYLTQLWFVFFNGYSGTSIHDRWTIGLYNLVFSCMPILVLAVLDRDVPASVAEKFPELYYQGHKNAFFNARVFVGWIVNSIFHSVVCFFVPFFCLVGAKFPDGQDIDTYSIGIVVYSCVLVVITIKIALETSSWTWMHVVFYLGSLLIWPLFIFVYGSLFYAFRFPYPVLKEFYDILQEYRIFLTPHFWVVLMVTVAICCLRDVFWKFWVRIQSRKLYYEVQATHDKKSREEIMQHFPFEEGLPVTIKRKRRSPLEAQNLKKFFTNITKPGEYRGFAFSQTENQQNLISEYYGDQETK
ncbi:hypothetical protein FDP41_004414 [Naegleria fowleri]|uniref:Phospholipid-transporting ATPase n=1 Tax=Naegleria fowleri TaxID=5763 RepID=A0A6A5BSZ8_NAEFO|nr:uncharacterized protein FDP41_004414 [Naegleria fowleri]KAF0976515.1 hypothetical protein FDP41_004414 [Naegleria fowleri]